MQSVLKLKHSLNKNIDHDMTWDMRPDKREYKSLKVIKEGWKLILQKKASHIGVSFEKRELTLPS